MKSVGTVLTELRKACGINQTTVAAHVGVNQSTWSRIEKGRSGLTVVQLMLAAEALGTKASKILARVERGSK